MLGSWSRGNNIRVGGENRINIEPSISGEFNQIRNRRFNCLIKQNSLCKRIVKIEIEPI